MLRLRFLGDVDFEDLVLIRRRLREIDFSSFEVSLSDLGIFGGNNLNVLYVELNGGGVWKLRNEACRVLGLESDEDFKSHLTLCWSNKVFDKNGFVEEMGKVCVCKKKFLVEKISLVEGQGRFSRVLEEFGLR